MITLFCIQPKGFNVGNDAIHIALRHMLYEAFGEVVNVISLPATSRYESHGKAGLTARTIHEINQYGHGVIVGGGNLYENGELDLNLDALEELEPPLMLFSLSRGRIYNRHGELVNRTDAMPRQRVAALNRKAGYSLARDQATLDFLHDLGCDHAELGGCPTIFLDRVAGRLPALPPNEPGGVLISVRNPDLMNIPLARQAAVRKEIERLIGLAKLLNQGPVRLLCHDHRDIPFAATFADADYVYTGDVYSYLALLRASTLNISFRLHATLPCISMGTPSVSISYDERAQSVLDTVGLGEWNIRLMECDDLVDAVADRCSRLGDLWKIVENAEPRWRKLHQTMHNALTRFRDDVAAYRGGEVAQRRSA